jgi:hypothetical protein
MYVKTKELYWNINYGIKNIDVEEYKGNVMGEA